MVTGTLRSRRLANQFKNCLIVLLATTIASLILWKPHSSNPIIRRHRSIKNPPTHYSDSSPAIAGGNHLLLGQSATVKPDQTFFHTYPDNNRYISGDIWRPPQSFGDPIFRFHGREQEKQLGRINLQQSLYTDHTPNSDNILLLIKTGTLTAWERMPVHFFTTLTRFPNFALYSDSPDSIAGYEVIDILANISQELLIKSDQFLPYRQTRELRSKHSYLSSKEKSIGGGWTLDKFKNLKMFQHAYHEAPDMDWYIMIDDDTVVFADNLSSFLARLDPSKPYYLGSAVAGLEYVFAHGGSGIVLSQGAMAKAFGDPNSDEWVESYTSRAEKECCGDYMVAMYLKETVDISLDFETSGGRFQGEPIWALPASAINWCQEIITLHHQSPADFELLWEYEKIRSNNNGNNRILYSDLYNDFAKPYFPREPQRNWDNGAKDIEYSWSKDLDDKSIASAAPEDRNKPYTSYDSCRQACEGKPDCIMYRFDPYTKYCGLSASTIALGRPVVKYDDAGYHDRLRRLQMEIISREPNNEAHQMISGWYLDRVIAMRQGQPCDRLHKSSEADGHINDIKDQVEGWWIRAKSRYPDSYPDLLKHF